jgi:DNA-binding NtrC family response regulator
MKKGVYDFIQKPFRTKDIELIIKLALDTRKLDKELKLLLKTQAEKYGITSIIGKSKKIEEIFKIIKKVAISGANSVLILGESGTGKELIAKAIHYESKRAIWPFVAINCSAIPPNLLESELYGHEKGSFTDAKERKIGLFEKAHKGTLFLDEIGDMSYDLQTKLLRTLEERKIRRIGGTSDISIDIQLVAATNQNLAKLVEEGKFRKDLYYRLKVIEIYVPPLRERREDIIPLAKYFLDQYNKKLNKHFIGFEKSAEEALINYSYPGNVRELKNIIEKILILEDDKYIKLEYLPQEARQSELNESSEVGIIQDVYDMGLENYIKQQEIKYIKEALKKCNGNKSEAAKLLNIDRSTLRYKIKLYGIE